jgi:hypothetical protein
VEDSGPGIDSKDVERIFDALFTTKSKGMGMGLSIYRSIIEAYHGRLWVSPGRTTDRPFISCCRPWPSKLNRSCRADLRRVSLGDHTCVAQAEGALGNGPVAGFAQ